MARRTKQVIDAERLAILETKVEGMESKLDDIDKKLSDIAESVARGKGFWGAVLVIISAVWAVFTQVIPAMFSAKTGT